ncbi:hypothetical protein LU298_10385 [Komagataeibacter intermedius]|uniref:Uncharacterized protein n=1 Tax=Komagataeibacter intermedius AF2 TaxID=1458464 RepID=A0A0C1UXN3_9PROT|nr:hypothetical protein [Komagataeibacter intermedius]KPH86030.1 hypothetical protein GLUCOINTEAF2_0200881 [Komagataeibacter intermedius AF2]KPH86396.1 hypothetical protein GLUCOINTEAF2_0200816 [Komagataeibacter intermedius AF2]MCF3636900.1 hypothetical protein [Komagataeibacter intermedius]GAN86528.1 hypothetical protein Gain_0031_023 [Komagataeibacter intermedius TF2]
MKYSSDGNPRDGRAPVNPTNAPPFTTPEQKRHGFIVGCMVVFFVTLIAMVCWFFPQIPLPRF